MCEHAERGLGHRHSAENTNKTRAEVAPVLEQRKHFPLNSLHESKTTNEVWPFTCRILLETNTEQQKKTDLKFYMKINCHERLSYATNY